LVWYPPNPASAITNQKSLVRRRAHAFDVHAFAIPRQAQFPCVPSVFFVTFFAHRVLYIESDLFYGENPYHEPEKHPGIKIFNVHRGKDSSSQRGAFLAVFLEGPLPHCSQTLGRQPGDLIFSGRECLKRKYIIKRKNVEPKKEVNNKKPRRGGTHAAIEGLDKPSCVEKLM